MLCDLASAENSVHCYEGRWQAGTYQQTNQGTLAWAEGWAARTCEAKWLHGNINQSYTQHWYIDPLTSIGGQSTGSSNQRDWVWPPNNCRLLNLCYFYRITFKFLSEDTNIIIPREKRNYHLKLNSASWELVWLIHKMLATLTRFVYATAVSVLADNSVAKVLYWDWYKLTRIFTGTVNIEALYSMIQRLYLLILYIQLGNLTHPVSYHTDVSPHDDLHPVNRMLQFNYSFSAY